MVFFLVTLLHSHHSRSFSDKRMNSKMIPQRIPRDCACSAKTMENGGMKKRKRSLCPECVKYVKSLQMKNYIETGYATELKLDFAVPLEW